MWNDSYKEYVKTLVESNRKEYPYYVAHTCTYWNISNSSSLPSFKVYFSKEPITSTGLYSYELPADTVVYNVVGGNANNTYHNARVTTNTTKGNLSIDNYEFVFTNAETTATTVQPDILATTEVTQSHFDGVSLIIICILLGTVVARLIKR